jgi:hypothetical protein
VYPNRSTDPVGSFLRVASKSPTRSMVKTPFRQCRTDGGEKARPLVIAEMRHQCTLLVISPSLDNLGVLLGDMIPTC